MDIECCQPSRPTASNLRKSCYIITTDPLSDRRRPVVKAVRNPLSRKLMYMVKLGILLKIHPSSGFGVLDHWKETRPRKWMMVRYSSVATNVSRLQLSKWFPMALELRMVMQQPR